jgi:hypothetical protein
MLSLADEMIFLEFEESIAVLITRRRGRSSITSRRRGRSMSMSMSMSSVLCCVVGFVWNSSILDGVEYLL